MKAYGVSDGDSAAEATGEFGGSMMTNIGASVGFFVDRGMDGISSVALGISDGDSVPEATGG